jgi:pyruvate,water dikinase
VTENLTDTSSRDLLTAKGLLNQPTYPDTPWTRVNLGEAVPGVLTPFDWAFIGHHGEAGANRSFLMLGVYAPAEVPVPEKPEDRSSGVFFGRLASNVDRMRVLGDRVPGLSGDGIERQYFGGVRDGVENHPAWARYPVVLAKSALALRRMPARLERLRAETDRWWRASVAPGVLEDPAVARAVLRESGQRYSDAMAEHCVCALSTIGMYDTVYRLAARAGVPGAETRILANLGDLEETRLIDDLFKVADGDRSVEWFLDRHGYHGEFEGAPSGHSWREEPAVVEALVEGYRRADRAGVRARRAQAAVAAADATAELLASLPTWRRITAKSAIGRAIKYLPWREVGKAAFVQCIDVARAAARAIGSSLVAEGRLHDVDEVFLLTVDELLDDVPVGRAVIEERREMRRLYESITIPESFIGEPEPETVTTMSEPEPTASEVAGFGCSSGTITGPARVVLEDDRAGAMEPGEVLVCPMTDPSWAPFYVLASALVIDVGGPLSHGAIIAREMGVPCVINTQVGTKVIRTGDTVEVDGDAGTVKVLSTNHA